MNTRVTLKEARSETFERQACVRKLAFLATWTTWLSVRRRSTEAGCRPACDLLCAVGYRLESCAVAMTMNFYCSKETKLLVVFSARHQALNGGERKREREREREWAPLRINKPTSRLCIYTRVSRAYTCTYEEKRSGPYADEYARRMDNWHLSVGTFFEDFSFVVAMR